MKSVAVLLLVLVVVLVRSVAQETDTLKKTRYAVELNHFVTGSGFGPGTELYMTVIPDHRKNISLGLYVSPSTKKISGVTLHHERSLGRRAATSALVPFAFYNLIYRITKSRELQADRKVLGDYALYKSMEHHLGLGLQVRLFKQMYMKSAVGYGVYLGSIKKPGDPDPVTGEISGGNGLGPIAKTGFNFVF